MTEESASGPESGRSAEPTRPVEQPARSSSVGRTARPVPKRVVHRRVGNPEPTPEELAEAAAAAAQARAARTAANAGRSDAAAFGEFGESTTVGAADSGYPASSASGYEPPGGEPPSGSGPPPSTPRPRPERKASRWWELPVLAIVAILVAILVKTFLVQPFYIPSQSMEKTLHGCPGCNGDKILVNKVVYHSRDPHPGEIVVFRAPDGWEAETVAPQTNAVTGAIRWFGQLVGVIPPDEKDLVKRVIAVGGQTVRGDAQGHVQISNSGADGPWRTLTEPYVYEDGVDSYATFGPVTIPKGRLWVMGDHRNDSQDSRGHCGDSLTSCDPSFSTVPVSRVIGKAFVVAWPISRWSTLGTPSTFTSKTSAEAASGLPLVVGFVVVGPIWWLRRRRGRGSPRA